MSAILPGSLAHILSVSVPRAVATRSFDFEPAAWSGRYRSQYWHAADKRL